MIADLDDSDLGLSSDNEEKQEEGSDGGWDASDDNAEAPKMDEDEIADNWEDAPDSAEIERKKKEEEEAKKKAEEEAAEAEKQRKEMKRLMREKAKELKKSLEAQNSDDDEAGLFDVEIARDQQKQQDFNLAVDALGLDFSNEKIEVSDIMNFSPDTIGDFEALRKELVKSLLGKINLKSKDVGQKIGCVIKALIDDYKSVQMKEINTLLINLCNEKLHQQRLKQGKKDKKQQTSNKTFFNTKDDNDDDGFM